ncbi:uncharacterized protein EAF02_002509 [Botrytis sinoallii]|uniref:uncharacterized protein n=1 Tax=Botrytis sinoallii TaxID=1463999 RepID=UPI0018FFD52C|nr:uncharacterized protein EAF02_002509 [Botrytis sinoallii]KAF7890094.1 hypothetical protein EAF02_002509 [Botrytis sinoallii]
MNNISLIASFLAIAVATSAIGTPDPNLEVRADPDDLMIFLTLLITGAFCAGIGESLQYDKPDSSTKRNRRKAAGCIASGGNRCSVKKGHASGFQCDEYPFASSIPSNGATTRLNRCVPAAQNRKQERIISAFYKSSYYTGNNGGKLTFTANFSNSGDIGYCNSEECDADDDNEIIGPGGTASDGDSAEDGTDDDPDAGQKKKKKIKRRNGLGKRLPGAPVYRTSSGLELDIPGGADEQARFGNPNQTREFHGDEDEDEDEEDYDYMLANLDIREDTIVEEIVPAV